MFTARRQITEEGKNEKKSILRWRQRTTAVVLVHKGRTSPGVERVERIRHQKGGAAAWSTVIKGRSLIPVQTLENSATQADKDVLFFFLRLLFAIFQKHQLFAHIDFQTLNFLPFFFFLVWLPHSSFFPHSVTSIRNSTTYLFQGGLKIREKLIKCWRTAGW